MNDLVIRDGVAAPQGGGILNYGELSLDRVVVTANTQNRRRSGQLPARWWRHLQR
jgi:hypothetical protein